MNWKKLFIIFLFTLPISFISSVEKINRGLVAIQNSESSVFLSWRLFFTDNKDKIFRLYKSKDDSKMETLLTEGFITNYLDNGVTAGETIKYTLRVYYNEKVESFESYILKIGKDYKPYIEIPLSGGYTFQQVTVADLDGDGDLEFIIKQPNYNVDPYQSPGYWKKSETTYKIEAYKIDGKMLWQYDMGWSIEAGIWYSPWIVYDLDGDGLAEVYCKAADGDYRDQRGVVERGDEYLAKIDGLTGKVIKKIPWISRKGYPDYNYASRNFLNIAFLDGVNPSLIMSRGTYNLIRTQAFDKDLNLIWKWQSKWSGYPDFWGQGAHTLICSDIDQDGFDEIVLGAAALEESGKEKWSLQKGHPDVIYIADIDPDIEGLEIFYGFETRQDRHGLCLVSAKSGKIIWGHPYPTNHIHNQGMIADILSEHKGIEVYAGERDEKVRWLYSAKGKLIEKISDLPLTIRSLWWDDDPQKEVIVSNNIQKWRGKIYQNIQGTVIAIMDCIGDFREEVIVSYKGALRIYTTTVLANRSYPCLLLDKQYRKGVITQTMGYYYPAQLSLENSSMIK